MNPDKPYMNLADDEGPAYLVLGDLITFKVTGADTGGAYSLVEALSPPGNGPAFLHTHSPQESFYVLEGDYEIYGRRANGDKYAIAAPPGTTVHVPAGEPHGFRNVGATTGRMLLTYHPAEPMLAFFRDIGLPVTDRANPPGMDELPGLEEALAAMARHNFELFESPG